MIINEDVINILSELNTINFINFNKVIDVDNSKITITFEMQSDTNNFSEENIKKKISENIKNKPSVKIKNIEKDNLDDVKLSKNDNQDNLEFRETSCNTHIPDSFINQKRQELKDFCQLVGAKFDNLDYAPIEPMKFGSSGVYNPQFINYKPCPTHWAIDVYTNPKKTAFKTYRFISASNAKEYHSIVVAL